MYTRSLSWATWIKSILTHLVSLKIHFDPTCPLCVLHVLSISSSASSYLAGLIIIMGAAAQVTTASDVTDVRKVQNWQLNWIAHERKGMERQRWLQNAFSHLTLVLNRSYVWLHDCHYYINKWLMHYPHCEAVNPCSQTFCSAVITRKLSTWPSFLVAMKMPCVLHVFLVRLFTLMCEIFLCSFLGGGGRDVWILR
jgi:hypothetical protein